MTDGYADAAAGAPGARGAVPIRLTATLRNNGRSNPSATMDQPLIGIIGGVVARCASVSTTTQAMLTTSARIVVPRARVSRLRTTVLGGTAATSSALAVPGVPHARAAPELDAILQRATSCVTHASSSTTIATPLHSDAPATPSPYTAPPKSTNHRTTVKTGYGRRELVPGESQ